MGGNNQQRRTAKRVRRERRVQGRAAMGRASWGVGVGGAPGVNGFGGGQIGTPPGGWDDDVDGDDEWDDDDAWSDEWGEQWDEEEDDLRNNSSVADAVSGLPVPALVEVAVQAVGAGNQALVDQALICLVTADASGREAAGHATRVLLDQIAALYEKGWQPADLLHVMRRKLTVSGTRTVAVGIGRQAVVAGAAARAPDDWLRQLGDVAAEAAGTRSEGLPATQWRTDSRLDVWTAWEELLALLSLLSRLPAMERLVDPPSRWRERTGPAGGSESPAGDRSTGSAHSGRGAGSRTGPGASRRPGSGTAGPGQVPPGGNGDARPKMLGRIRALLAKAESTDFPDEAEALTAKAQHLMSRYSIDEAVLHAGGAGASGIRARRFHLDDPYAATKVQLLNSVGSANRTKVIWHGDLGIATVVGDPLDLDMVDLLFTSLLVQATRAVTDAGRASSHSRSASFRRAFLLAYAQRIGERLARANADEVSASGAELVLAGRSRAVDEEFQRLFPQTRTVRTRRVDASGWHAGRAAADRAVIARGAVDGGR